MLDKNFVDLDPVFNMNIDEDYDFRASGITRNSFCNVYMEWICFCAVKRSQVSRCNQHVDTLSTNSKLKENGLMFTCLRIMCLYRCQGFLVFNLLISIS